MMADGSHALVYAYELLPTRIKGADIVLLTDVVLGSIWARSKNPVKPLDVDLVKRIFLSLSCVICNLSFRNPRTTFRSVNRIMSPAFSSNFESCCSLLTTFRTQLMPWTMMADGSERRTLKLPSTRIDGADLVLLTDVLLSSIWARNEVKSYEDVDLIKLMFLSASWMIATLSFSEPPTSFRSMNRAIPPSFFGSEFLILKSPKQLS